MSLSKAMFVLRRCHSGFETLLTRPAFWLTPDSTMAPRRWRRLPRRQCFKAQTFKHQWHGASCCHAGWNARRWTRSNFESPINDGELSVAPKACSNFRIWFLRHFCDFWFARSPESLRQHCQSHLLFCNSNGIFQTFELTNHHWQEVLELDWQLIIKKTPDSNWKALHDFLPLGDQHTWKINLFFNYII